MSQFNEEQLKEILDATTKALGLEEGKTIADTMKEIVNGTLNAYDKRVSKERTEAGEKLDETLKGITDSIAKLGEGGGTGDAVNLDDPEGEIDIAKLPKGVQALFERQQAAMKKVADQVEAEKQAREQAEAKAQKEADERAAQTLRDAIRTTALDKETLGIEFDPAMSGVLVEHLVKNVRKAETGDGYEYQTGIDDISKEPVFKSLAEGLKEFGATAIGKRFQVPVKGSGPGAPKGNEGRKAGQVLTADDLNGLTPAQIREAANKGEIQLDTQ